MPRRILLNTKYGGFSLSKRAKQMYLELTKDIERPKYWFIDQDVRRDDPILLNVIDTLGLEESAGEYARLAITEIPDDIPADGWIICEYDGMEWVAEKHRTWHA